MSDIFDDELHELDLDEDLSPGLQAQMERVRVRHGLREEEAPHRRAARREGVRRLIEDWVDSRSLSQDLDYL
ncbi:MAG: hypothetical protein P8Y95_06710 [Gammaproteobacteria bacterium]